MMRSNGAECGAGCPRQCCPINASLLLGSPARSCTDPPGRPLSPGRAQTCTQHHSTSHRATPASCVAYRAAYRLLPRHL
ncbi:hypothetical protein HaLaN_25907 [Haematococcus lacustris]|uniref:Uncharacterized protein n=1 Tax=Haematococcus lacustris TaxID=44745 RepID=A0A699ZZD1_HAELA|nr:hypothetical protein HaLaN_25907 [Haematococcus lacustris]